MNKIRICLVGGGGYGRTYLKIFWQVLEPETFALVGIVDPYIESVPDYSELVTRKIPLYKTLEDFLRFDKADLVIISTPIFLHKEQTEAALSAGCNVLCEKPLAPRLQDVYELQRVAKETGKLLGVGFQHSFSDNALRLKRDIINGEFGAPMHFKTVIATPRYDDYYARGWCGRIKTGEQKWVLDSNLMNAYAHYIQDIFWLLGSETDTALMPERVSFSMYRAKRIESFDTCFVSGVFESGTTFNFIASHSSEKVIPNTVEYRFEKAIITYDNETMSFIASFNNGQVKEYGSGKDELAETAEKVTKMMEAIKTGESISSPPQSIIPHLALCNAMLDLGEIYDIPQDYCFRTREPQGTMVEGLDEILTQCFEKNVSPFELKVPWAKQQQEIKLKGYKKFSGDRFSG